MHSHSASHYYSSTMTIGNYQNLLLKVRVAELVCESAEVAELVAFLVSESTVNGSKYVIDSGTIATA